MPNAKFYGCIIAKFSVLRQQDFRIVFYNRLY